MVGEGKEEVVAAAVAEVEVALTLVLVVDKHEAYRFMLHQLLCKAETCKNLIMHSMDFLCFLVVTHDVYICVNLQSNDSLITFSI